MDLEYNGVYKMVEIDQFILPSSLQDLAKVGFIVTQLLTIKVRYYI